MRSTQIKNLHWKQTLACAALVFWGVAAVHAQDTAGYVIALRGAWVADSVALAAGSPVVHGGKIQPKEAASSITVAYLDGSAKTYTAAFTVVARRAEASGPGRMLAAVVTVMKTGERPAVFGMSRGSAEIHAAVLKLTGKRLDLAPAMGALGSAEYAVELVDGAGATAAAAKCNFDAPLATSATVPPLAGVYTLRVSSSSGTPLGDAAVLIVAPAAFESKSAEFRKGVELTAAWPPDTDPSAVRQFLAALLLDLAGR